MKRNAIIRIVLFSLAILVLLSILITGIGAKSFMANRDWSLGNFSIEIGTDNVNGTASSSGTANPDEISKINIQWAAGSISILPGDVDQITFQETGNFDEDNAMVWNLSGNTLNIQFAKSQVFFGISYNGSEKDLVITVPQDWNCQDLELDVASAVVLVQDLTVKSIDFDGASGTFDLENCSVDQLDIDTASGDIEFNGTLNELACSSASANITCVLANVPRNIEMEMASGDLDLTLPEDCGFTFSMDALSGEFTSDFPTSSRDGDYIYGNGSCYISVDAMSGDVIIRKG